MTRKLLWMTKPRRTLRCLFRIFVVLKLIRWMMKTFRITQILELQHINGLKLQLEQGDRKWAAKLQKIVTLQPLSLKEPRYSKKSMSFKNKTKWMWRQMRTPLAGASWSTKILWPVNIWETHKLKQTERENIWKLQSIWEIIWLIGEDFVTRAEWTRLIKGRNHYKLTSQWWSVVIVEMIVVTTANLLISSKFHYRL